jgi:antitoxin (DNA-binding transcriptional repressor) of toxin-antitoxin stability system
MQEDYAMKSVDVTELHEHTGEVLAKVRNGETLEVIESGVTIARLVPVSYSLSDEEIEEILEDLDTLAAEISAKWPKGVSAQDAIDDVRR